MASAAPSADQNPMEGDPVPFVPLLFPLNRENCYDALSLCHKSWDTNDRHLNKSATTLIFRTLFDFEGCEDEINKYIEECEHCKYYSSELSWEKEEPKWQLVKLGFDELRIQTDNIRMLTDLLSDNYLKCKAKQSLDIPQDFDYINDRFTLLYANPTKQLKKRALQNQRRVVSVHQMLHKSIDDDQKSSEAVHTITPDTLKRIINIVSMRRELQRSIKQTKNALEYMGKTESRKIASQYSKILPKIKTKIPVSQVVDETPDTAETGAGDEPTQDTPLDTGRCASPESAPGDGSQAIEENMACDKEGDDLQSVQNISNLGQLEQKKAKFAPEPKHIDFLSYEFQIILKLEHQIIDAISACLSDNSALATTIVNPVESGNLAFGSGKVHISPDTLTTAVKPPSEQSKNETRSTPTTTDKPTLEDAGTQQAQSVTSLGTHHVVMSDKQFEKTIDRLYYIKDGADALIFQMLETHKIAKDRMKFPESASNRTADTTVASVQAFYAFESYEEEFQAAEDLLGAYTNEPAPTHPASSSATHNVEPSQRDLCADEDYADLFGEAHTVGAESSGSQQTQAPTISVESSSDSATSSAHHLQGGFEQLVPSVSAQCSDNADETAELAKEEPEKTEPAKALPSGKKKKYISKQLRAVKQRDRGVWSSCDELAAVFITKNVATIALKSMLALRDLDLNRPATLRYFLRSEIKENDTVQFLAVLAFPCVEAGKHYVMVCKVMTPQWYLKHIWNGVVDDLRDVQKYTLQITNTLLLSFKLANETVPAGETLKMLLPAANYGIAALLRNHSKKLKFVIVPDCFVEYYLGHVVHLMEYLVSNLRTDQLTECATICDFALRCTRVDLQVDHPTLLRSIGKLGMF